MRYQLEDVHWEGDYDADGPLTVVSLPHDEAPNVGLTDGGSFSVVIDYAELEAALHNAIVDSVRV